MSMTATAWIAALQAMMITGVTRHYDYPPASLSTADLPALLMLNFGVSANPSTLVTCEVQKQRTCTILIAIAPVAQGLQSTHYETYKTLSDATETAIDALTVCDFISYTMRTTTQEEIASIGYWGIIIQISGSTQPL